MKPRKRSYAYTNNFEKGPLNSPPLTTVFLFTKKIAVLLYQGDSRTFLNGKDLGVPLFQQVSAVGGSSLHRNGLEFPFGESPCYPLGSPFPFSRRATGLFPLAFSPVTAFRLRRMIQGTQLLVSVC